jgi:hypothetical protein
MEFLEKNLEEIIFETSTNDLALRNLRLYGKRYRQLRIGAYGIADLVTLERLLDTDDNNQKIIITVYELKKDKINISSLAQASRYVKGIQRYFDAKNIFQFTEIEYKIVLIGKTIETSGDFVFLTDFLNDKIDCYTYDYKFNGINFIHKNNWFITEEKF